MSMVEINEDMYINANKISSIFIQEEHSLVNDDVFYVIKVKYADDILDWEKHTTQEEARKSLKRLAAWTTMSFS